MAKVEVAKARSVISEEPAGLRIRIPTKRNWFVLAFLCCWLGGWGVGETTVAWHLFSGGDSFQGGGSVFMVAWLGVWTLGGAAVLTTILWMAVGEEVVLVRSDSLVLRRVIFGIGSTKEYELANVKNLRVNASAANDTYGYMTGARFWGVAGNLITFDYGARTYRFGNGVDEPEAVELVEAIKRRITF